MNDILLIGDKVLDIAIVCSIAILGVLFLALAYISIVEKSKKQNKKIGVDIVTDRAIMLSEATIAIKIIDNFKVMIITDNLNLNYLSLLLDRISKVVEKFKFNNQAIDSIARLYNLIDLLSINLNNNKKELIKQAMLLELSAILIILKKI